MIKPLLQKQERKVSMWKVEVFYFGQKDAFPFEGIKDHETLASLTKELASDPSVVKYLVWKLEHKQFGIQIPR